MVTVEKRIQLAIKEILEEETWKHLKTNNNFDKVLSIASLIEPFDEGLEYVCETDTNSWPTVGGKPKVFNTKESEEVVSVAWIADQGDDTEENSED